MHSSNIQYLLFLKSSFKTIKLISSILVFIFIAIIITSYCLRIPSYTIKTTGKLYIVNKLSRDLTVFDLYTGKTLEPISIGVESHSATTLSDQNRVVVTNYATSKVRRKNITIINTKRNTIEKRIEFNDGFLGLDGVVAFPKSNKVAVVSYINNDFSVIDIETGIVEKKIGTQQKMSHVFVFNPKKPLVYVTNIVSGSVSVLDFNLNKVIKIIQCGSGSEGIDITPDGSEIWVSNNIENTINVINTYNNQVISTLRAGKEPKKLKFSKNGKYCLVANASDGTVSVFDQQSKKEIKVIRLHGKQTLLERLLYHTPRPVNILMHPNGLYAFISNSNANKIEVIDLKTFRIVSTIGTGKIPDGLTLVN